MNASPCDARLVHIRLKDFPGSILEYVTMHSVILIMSCMLIHPMITDAPSLSAKATGECQDTYLGLGHDLLVQKTVNNGTSGRRSHEPTLSRKVQTSLDHPTRYQLHHSDSIRKYCKEQ